jgi:hypothetical protein
LAVFRNFGSLILLFCKLVKYRSIVPAVNGREMHNVAAEHSSCGHSPLILPDGGETP